MCVLWSLSIRGVDILSDDEPWWRVRLSIQPVTTKRGICLRELSPLTNFSPFFCFMLFDCFTYLFWFCCFRFNFVFVVLAHHGSGFRSFLWSFFLLYTFGSFHLHFGLDMVFVIVNVKSWQIIWCSVYLVLKSLREFYFMRIFKLNS